MNRIYLEPKMSKQKVIVLYSMPYISDSSFMKSLPTQRFVQGMTMNTLVGRATATNGHQNGAITARPRAAPHPLRRITPIGVNE